MKFNQGLTTNFCREHMESFCAWNGCNEEAEIDDNGERKYCSIHIKSREKKEESEFIASLEHRMDMDNVTISTGDLDSEYTIIDTIMVFDYDLAGLVKGAEPAEAFDLVKEKLRETAVEKGGDAVINCQFQFRVAVAPKLLFWAQAFEMYAYGTVVKRSF
tara:strand:+ start:1838 stop:2317 length:480 start_codon:yes stop_codon:yes gene_type:complete